MATRKTSRGLMALAVVGFAASSLAACGGSSDSSSGDGSDSAGGGDKSYNIGVLVPEENQNAYSASYSKNIKKKAESLGVSVTLLNSDYDGSKQQSQMQQLIAKKVDGIILWPAAYGTTQPMLLAAKKANIPVNISNSVVSEEEKEMYHTFTGPSDTRIGADQADIVNDLLGGKGNVVLITGAPGNTAATGRENGFKDQLAKVAPDIKILGTQPADWLQAKAQTATSNLLTRHGDKVNAVITADDVEAAGAAAAIDNAGKTGKIKLVGSGYYEVTPPLVKDGKETATLFQSPCWDAVHAMEKMVAVLNGETVEKEYIMPVPKVTKDNMDEFEPMGCLPGDTL